MRYVILPKNQFVDLYPLDAFLEQNGRRDLDRSHWTPELADMVACYLLELPDDAYNQLLQELVEIPADGGREGQVASIIAENDPIVVGRAAHYAAVFTTSSLELLIDSIISTPQERAQQEVIDVAEWSDKNATGKQRAAIVWEVDPAARSLLNEAVREKVYMTDWFEWAESEGRTITIHRLLKAWQTVKSPEA